MKRLKEIKVNIGTTLLLCIVSIAVAVSCSYMALSWRTQAIQTKLREIDRIVTQRFIGKVDGAQLADYAAVGYITGLGDKWSGYIPAEQYEAYQMTDEGKGSGIGVMVSEIDGALRVGLVYDDSPAQKAGIQKGDWILGAEDLTVEKDGASAVISAIQGEEGSEVRVTVRQQADAKEVVKKMTRAVVTQKMAWGEMLPEKIGYLRIESFHVGMAEQFQAALDRLLKDGAKGLILDVRHNGGGRVVEMSEALDPLLPEGTIMTLRSKDGKERVYESDAEKIDLPMTVLVDDRSISAAEFFAAALKEYDCATIVGTHTTGKGRAQQTFRLSDGSAINLSVEEYYTPKGNSLADVGIAPDVEVALTQEQEKNFYLLDIATDPQLQKAHSLLV